MSEIDTREAYLKRQLGELHRRYAAEAKPIIAQLVKIESLKGPKPVILPAPSFAANEALTVDALNFGIAVMDGQGNRIAPEDFYENPSNETT